MYEKKTNFLKIGNTKFKRKIAPRDISTILATLENSENV